MSAPNLATIDRFIAELKEFEDYCSWGNRALCRGLNELQDALNADGCVVLELCMPDQIDAKPLRDFLEDSFWRGAEQAREARFVVESVRKRLAARRTGIEQNEEGSEEKIQNLRPSHRRAYLAFQAAESKAERALTDREAYKNLEEKDILEDTPGLADYRLPKFYTWTRHLRAARKALGDTKYTKRQGRPHGKSIVRENEI